MEKLLPQSEIAEQGVLGSIIIDPEAITKVGDFLKAEHFYSDKHGQIYAAILHMYQMELPADLISLSDELERREQLESVGGTSYITSLINDVPTSGNVESYGHIVEQKSIMRRLIHAAGEIAASAYHEDEEAVKQAEDIIFRIASGGHGKAVRNHVVATDDYMEAMLARHDAHANGILSGIPTPFPVLNKKWGGLRKSKFYVIGARPGEGKTSLALGFALFAIALGFNVLFFSLEMDEEEMIQRILSYLSGVNGDHLRDGTLADDEWERVMDARKLLEAMPGKLLIDDTSGNTMGGMRSKAMRAAMEDGVDLAIVDYVQLTRSDPTPGKRQQERRLELGEVSRGLKQLSRDMKIPVIGVAQLNRNSEERSDKVPRMSDLRECGDFEQDADSVLLIAKDPEEPKEAESYGGKFLIDKNRGGAKGPVDFWFNGSLTRFYPSAGGH